MKKFFIILFILSISLNLFAQEFKEEKMTQQTPPPGMRGVVPNLPDISVIGDFHYKLSTDKEDNTKDKLVIEEIETAFQGYLYPNIRADVFLAIHKHDEHVKPEISEAKVSFQKLIHNLSLEVGKIHVNFGKLNKIHQHHRNFYDQPVVLTNFFGEHGLVAEGFNFSYILPLPLFLQIDLGFWNIPLLHHDEESQHNEFSLVDKTYTNKIWISVPIKTSELEIGLNSLLSNGPHYQEHKDEVKIFGIDLTFRSFFTRNRKFLFTTEVYKLLRDLEDSSKERFGYFVFTNYKFNKYDSVGLRYDDAEEVVEGLRTNSLSAIYTRSLTETTALRTQYTYFFDNPKDVHQLVFQLVFGIGPHSHLLE
jgi:hypothetical protein